MRTVAVALLCMMLGASQAQSEVARVPIESTLVWQLIGVVEALEFDIAPDVQHVYVTARYQGRSVVTHEIESTSKARLHLGILPSSIAPPCSVQNSHDLYIFIASEDAGAADRHTPSELQFTFQCLTIDGDVTLLARAPGLRGLQDGGGEIRSDRWSALLAVGASTIHPSTRAFPERPDNAVVFYVYPSREPLQRNALPPLPPAASWSDLPTVD